MEKSKISVCIATFNGAKYIEKQLKSILLQLRDNDEVVISDDGSTDNSAELARAKGATVININPNRGLANAFRVGLAESLKRGADIIVNTDADNQYCADDIEKLVAPILENKADIVIGARDILSIQEFTPLKKVLQKFGSAILRLLSSTPVEDAPSGFRAFSKQAAIKLNVFDNYTYTMETLLQANAKGLRVLSVPIRVNKMLRKSKLVKNIFDYVFKSAKTTIRMFIVYRPFRFFITIAGLLGFLGILATLGILTSCNSFCSVEDNAAYLKKIETDLLMLDVFREELSGFSTMLDCEKALRAPLLQSSIKLWHKLFGRLERRVLVGDSPNLAVFNLYRIGFFISNQ